MHLGHQSFPVSVKAGGLITLSLTVGTSQMRMNVPHIFSYEPAEVGRGKRITWRRACTEHPDLFKECGDNHPGNQVVKRPHMDVEHQHWPSGNVQGLHL